MFPDISGLALHQWETCFPLMLSPKRLVTYGILFMIIPAEHLYASLNPSATQLTDILP